MVTKTFIIGRRTLLGLLPAGAALAAVRGDEVMYVGGTMKSIPEATEGELDTGDSKILRFHSNKGSFDIHYDQITSIEYGQKAGRRVGVAIVITVWALFSKKRKHFLTLGFKDEKGDQQGVVLELAKGKPKSTITIIEARSGKKCEYESEEARKHVHG